MTDAEFTVALQFLKHHNHVEMIQKSILLGVLFVYGSLVFWREFLKPKKSADPAEPKAEAGSVGMEGGR